MDEQFDNDLKNRIKEVFENFEDSSANEGWLLLRKKFPAEQSRRPLTWLWWGAAAAILLLFLGLAPSRYVAKIMSNSGAIVINCVSSSIINRAVKPMDVIQLTPRIWDYIKNFYVLPQKLKQTLILNKQNFNH